MKKKEYQTVCRQEFTPNCFTPCASSWTYITGQTLLLSAWTKIIMRITRELTSDYAYSFTGKAVESII